MKEFDIEEQEQLDELELEFIGKIKCTKKDI